MYHWKLTAQNIEGATVEFKEDTKKQVINKFDNVYYRKGWFIVLTKTDNETGHRFKKIVFKKTYR